MRRAILLIAISVWIPSCTSVRPIQLNPPIAAPPGLTWGYGVERIRNSSDGSGPDRARQGAYLKAVDDLLSRGPVIVSRVVKDSTTVVDARSSTRTMESTFRLLAAGILQPSSIRSGFEDGFAWVLVGTRPEDIERGWEEFLAWRETKIQEAELLFDHASGSERIGLLEASLAILEETGPADEPGLLYHRVRAALEVERESLAELESERENVGRWLATGQLVAARQSLLRARDLGLQTAEYHALDTQIENQRSRADSVVRAGDTLYDSGQFKEALERYENAQALDFDHPGLNRKIARAESAHRMARDRTTRQTLGVIGGIVGEYFRWRAEEARKERAEEASRNRREDRKD